MTAYQRLKGKRACAKVVPFGEKVLYMQPKDTKGRKNKVEPRFRFGVWAGVSRRTGAFIVLTPEGVKKARTVKRLPDGSRYD